MITLVFTQSHSRFCSVWRDVAVISCSDCIHKSFTHATISLWKKKGVWSLTRVTWIGFLKQWSCLVVFLYARVGDTNLSMQTRYTLKETTIRCNLIIHCLTLKLISYIKLFDITAFSRMSFIWNKMVSKLQAKPFWVLSWIFSDDELFEPRTHLDSSTSILFRTQLADD